MDKNENMYGETRGQSGDARNGSRINGNTNDPDSRSHSRDNSGMHAGGSRGSSYRQQQPDNRVQYGSRTGSYWEEKGSDREQSVGSRMNDRSLNSKR